MNYIIPLLMGLSPQSTASGLTQQSRMTDQREMSVTIKQGDCREVLRTLPAGSVQCCVTSPPYFGLRDYGVDGQIGLEPTPDAFIAAMVEVFREVRRVLADDGTLWLNLGDSYNTPNNRRDAAAYVSGGTSHLVEQEENRKASQRFTKDLKPKDLLMIPARVALALQAPDYLGQIRKETDRAWLAALVDGEGCITALETKSPHGSGSSYPPILQVRMCDTECIEHAASITGYGRLSDPQSPPSSATQRSSYQWRLDGRKAADIIAEIFPFLRIKRKQAIVAWNLQAVRDSYETKRGVKMPDAAREKQQLCRELIQKLNQRQPVDLPSWMIEPPQPIGPGWYLRSHVIWHKPNPMPESVTDRPTSSHESIFLMSKAARYFYDGDAVREAYSPSSAERYKYAFKADNPSAQATKNPSVGGGMIEQNDVGRNLRNVWTVPSQPFSGAHFATFPPALIEPCIKAGSRPGDTVLDPFGGAGTTGLVADRLNRNAILIELNPAYADMARNRLFSDAPLFAEIA